MPQVLNKKTSGVPIGAVYVGRPTKWGNPFPMHAESERDKVVADYRAFLARSPQLVAEARAELRGKDLVCWCAPRACHADVLMAAANSDAPLAELPVPIRVPATDPFAF